MEKCLKFLPRTSYPWYGLVALTIFVSIGVVMIGITSDFDSKATLQCNPDKTLASNLSTWKYIETKCFQKYMKEFFPFLSLHVEFIINFGLVLLLSVIYAYTVKHRVESFKELRREAVTGSMEEGRPIIGNLSHATSNLNQDRGSSRYYIFTVYVLHLIIFRILPLVVFAVLLLNSMTFPTQFHCPWSINSTSTLNVNVTQSQGRNVSIFDCTYPMGSENEKVSAAVISTDLLFASEAFIELAYLLWSAWKDSSFISDREFCCVYLLRKRKRIRKLSIRLGKMYPMKYFICMMILERKQCHHENWMRFISM